MHRSYPGLRNYYRSSCVNSNPPFFSADSLYHVFFSCLNFGPNFLGGKIEEKSTKKGEGQTDGVKFDKIIIYFDFEIKSPKKRKKIVEPEKCSRNEDDALKVSEKNVSTYLFVSL